MAATRETVEYIQQQHAGSSSLEAPVVQSLLYISVALELDG
ncbi:unnamed protein product [Candida parapsilosis]